MRAGLTAVLLAVFAAYSHLALAQPTASGPAAPPSITLGPPQPPTGDEREELIRSVRADFPTMPERLVPVFADARRQVSGELPCELLEWIASAGSNAPAPARASAELNLPICRLPVDDLTPDRAREMLGTRSIMAEVRDDTVTVVAQSANEAIRICCSVQGKPERLGDSNYWALRTRLPEADRAMLSFMIMGSGPTIVGTTPPPEAKYRGPLAPPAPFAAERPIQGRLVERQLASTALGETRRLMIYLPPGWAPAEDWPVVYLTDGAALGFAPLVDKLIADGKINPVVLVSAQPAPFGIVDSAPPTLGMDLRSAEYINRYPGGQGQDRFDRHMTFFAEELPAYAQAEFGVSSDREDVSVAGYSNGGVLALWAGLLHPETFGDAIAMSPGMVFVEESDLDRGPRATFHLSGGLYEPAFAKAARSTDEKLKAAGYDVTGRYLAAGHAQDQWQQVFAEAVEQIYRRD